MAVQQIYAIVNEVSAQALGTKSLAVVDNTGLIALGNTVLSSSTNTDVFINTLVQRIGKEIFSYRKYNSIFKDLMRNDFEWGNIVQKLKVQLIKAETDESYNLENGKSVDMYKVAKPEAIQKLFTTETPWQMHITIQDVHLREAFTSANAMGGFISLIFGEVQNSIEVALEGLGRNCLNNYIAEVSMNPKRAINLIALYKEKTGKTITTENAFYDSDFLRFTIAQIKLTSTRMTSIGTLFNDESTTRHTPKELQKLYVLADLETQLETVVQYEAFHKEYVSLNGYKVLPYLQAQETPMTIDVKKASDSKEVQIDTVVAMIFDCEALGTYKEDVRTLTTPMNGAGLYSNTYWHFKDMYFNDLSENFVMFYLEDLASV